jgi:hypothetical protein
MSEPNPTMERLEDRKSAYNQRMFKTLKAATIVIAVAIPLCAAFGAPATITAILGALIALIEAFQQMNQYQQYWITYRSTCEALKHEKYLFLGKAGPYASATNPLSLLAERVESLVSQENAKWASLQEQSPQGQDATGTP